MRMTIGNQLLLPIIGVVAVVMSAMAAYSYYTAREELTALYDEQLASVADSLQKNVRNMSRSMKVAIAAIATNADLAALLRSSGADREQALALARADMERFKRSYPEFRTLSLAGPEGTVLLSTYTASEGKVNVKDRPYFRAALERGDTTFSEPLVSRAINAKVVILATPVRAGDRVIGVLYANVDCDYLYASAVEGLRVGKAGYAYLLSSGGRFVAHQDKALVQEFDITGTTWGADLLRARNGRLDYSKEDGTPQTTAFRFDENSGWIAATVVGRDEITEVVHNMRNVNLLCMVLGLVVVAVVVFLTVRPIVRRIRYGVAFAQAVADRKSVV